MQDNVNDQCWICSNHIYTLIFWTESHGWDENDKIEGMAEELIIS